MSKRKLSGPPCWGCGGTVGPSEGCISTQPGPSKRIWKVSPESRPRMVLNETSDLTRVPTPPLHAMAESGSAEVGVLVSSKTGSPWAVTAPLPLGGAPQQHRAEERTEPRHGVERC